MHAPTRSAPALAALVALAAGAHPAPARANGRYPLARYLAAGPPERPEVLALQATFGVVLSTDSGRSWRWVCEEALGFSGTFDPAIAVTRGGAVVVGLPDGISVSRPDYCGFERPAGAPPYQVVDLTRDPLGDFVAAALTPVGAPARVAFSNNQGASFLTGWTGSDVFIETLDVAPGAPARLYMTGYRTGGIAALLRSDDGGASFRETTRDFGAGYNAFIVAVQQGSPDVLLVRSDVSDGTSLLARSDDGGGTLRELVRTPSPMVGAAATPDGATLWVAGNRPGDGIQRSRDGGRVWETLPTPFTPLCLRYESGVLYACADEARDGFALACSTDGGDTFVALLALEDIAGPAPCAPGTPVYDLCAPRWPSVRATLAASDAGSRLPHGTHRDAAVASDAASPLDAAPPLDAGGLDADAGGLDADVAPVLDATSPPPPPPRGCGCRVDAPSRLGQGARRAGWWAVLAGWIGATVRARRTARKGRRTAGRRPA